MSLIKLLKSLYALWLKFALVLSWINTRLILILLFYFIFTPLGLLLKLLRKDLLDININKTTKSYWRRKEEGKFGLAAYEKQF